MTEEVIVEKKRKRVVCLVPNEDGTDQERVEVSIDDDMGPNQVYAKAFLKKRGKTLEEAGVEEAQEFYIQSSVSGRSMQQSIGQLIVDLIDAETSYYETEIIVGHTPNEKLEDGPALSMALLSLPKDTRKYKITLQLIVE